MVSSGPVEKVVETEEDLHIFGLVSVVDGVVPAAQEPATSRGHHPLGRAKTSKFRPDTGFAPFEQPPAYPTNRCDEFGEPGRGGGGWGMTTGPETPNAAGHEERRSAAMPRAFAMNMDMAS